ncbi:DUF4433 domain-containing protein, partial [bacterium]|nr:DUF4433 domain-containing protein [bacterium]
DNIPSILEHGILSHVQVEKKGIDYTPIYSREIVEYRRSKQVSSDKTLWSYANLYFQPRNAMLYRVVFEKSLNDIAVIAVRPAILQLPDIYISTGGLGSPQSEILPYKGEGIKAIAKIRDATDKDWWNQIDGSKRELMAECLVPSKVPPELIEAIYVADHDIADNIKRMVSQHSIKVIPDPHMFFRSPVKVSLTDTLSIVEGDMFFSRLHTLTISVNCKGIMGKGLASTAKYRFPDVYVYYQDLCRNRKLRMGKPYLYKPETSFDYLLADEPSTLKKANAETWFLLFPTKDHWREQSNIQGIEKGLQWVQNNYRAQGIKSLAMPALGCGLGRLNWQDVGPLMCNYLSKLEIPVQIYLPVAGKIPEKYLSKDFLLPKATSGQLRY